MDQNVRSKQNKCQMQAMFICFLPRDASAERGDEIAFVCLSVCLSVCNDQVPYSNTLEFFENNFTAK